MADQGKLSPLLSHLLPGGDGADAQSAARTPNLRPAGADFYSGCVSISPAPVPGTGQSPLSQTSSAYTTYSNVRAGPDHGQKPHTPLHQTQSMLHDVYSCGSWDAVNASSTVVPSYCISETSCSAPVSMHGSIHARPNGWNSDKLKKGDGKLYGRGATDMRRCVTVCRTVW